MVTRPRAVVLLVAGAAVMAVLVYVRRVPVLDPAPPRQVSDSFYRPAEPPASTISIQLAVPTDILVRLLDDAVPRTFGTPDSLRALPDRGRASVGVALRRGSFRASLAGGTARIEATLRYGIHMSYDLPGLPDPTGSCGFGGGPEPRLSVAIESPMSIDRNWALVTRARLASLGPASSGPDDRCQITIFNIDVTDQVVDGARAFISDHLAGIDSRAAKIDTRSRFEQWWHTLQAPIELDDSLWLTMGPQSIRRGPVGGTGDSVSVALALRAHPRIVLGARPTRPFSPLPALDTGRVEPRLELLVDGRAEYGSGTQFLMDRLAGTRLDVGTRTLRIDSLRVYGIGGGRLTLEVHVSGDLSGRIFLTGRPVVDPTTERIAVPDLDFDVSSGQAMFGIVPRLAARPFRDFLRDQASWPVDPALQWLAKWLGQGLNRDIGDDLRVTGVVDSVRIVGVYAMKDALLVRMSARGSASLSVLP